MPKTALKKQASGVTDYSDDSFTRDQDKLITVKYYFTSLEIALSRQIMSNIMQALQQLLQAIESLPFKNVKAIDHSKIPFAKLGLLGQLLKEKIILPTSSAEAINIATIVMSFQNDIDTFIINFENRHLQAPISEEYGKFDKRYVKPNSAYKYLEDDDDDSTQAMFRIHRFFTFDKKNGVAGSVNTTAQLQALENLISKSMSALISKELSKYQILINDLLKRKNGTDLKQAIATINDTKKAELISLVIITQIRLSEYLKNKYVSVTPDNQDLNKKFACGKFRRLRNLIIHATDFVNGKQRIENILMDDAILTDFIEVNMNVIGYVSAMVATANNSYHMPDEARDIAINNTHLKVAALCHKIESIVGFNKNMEHGFVTATDVKEMLDYLMQLIDSVSSNEKISQFTVSWTVECIGECIGVLQGKNNNPGLFDCFYKRLDSDDLDNLNSDNRINVLFRNITQNIVAARNKAAHHHSYDDVVEVADLIKVCGPALKSAIGELIYAIEDLSSPPTIEADCRAQKPKI